jgi:Rrf2 family protein
MKISRRAQYAVAAVLDLALNAPGGGCRAVEIARRTGVPENFLDAVLLELRKAGVIASKRGPDGGHRLAQDPSRLTVASILLVIDGPASIAARPERRGGSPAEHSLQRLWSKVGDAVRTVTENTTVEDLRREAGKNVLLDYSI